MKKKLTNKIAIIILIMVVLRILVIMSLNHINIQSSRLITAQSNEIIINEKLENQLYTIVSDEETNRQKNSLDIHARPKTEFSLCINNLSFLHSIYINGELVSQNTDRKHSEYDRDYAYKFFDINLSDYKDNAVEIIITGGQADKATIFLAKADIAEESRELRTVVNAVILVLLVISTLAGLILYCYNRDKYYYLVFVLMGLVSVLKTIALGEISVLTQWLGLTAHHYTFIDQTTTIINTVLPLVIMCYLFDVKIKPRYVALGLTVIIFLAGMGIIKDGRALSYYNIMLLIAILTGNILIIWAFLKDKAYSEVIMVIASIYTASVIYYLLVLGNAYQSGSLLFFVHPAYLGAVVYMGGFFFAILLKHSDRIRVLENERKEYERVLLLRGIGHDLKLPLSVIKLNNQMIEKYNLSEEETKEYIKTSLEATYELEKMTENINSYLSLRQISTANETTSVRECFEKLKNYYSFYNQYDQYKFVVECDNQDCKLNISSLHFCRMLHNLVDNAFKYNKGEIRVTVRYKVDKKLVISIEDNGMGMDQAEIDKIFNPFYRIDHSRTTGGMGLGLSVVKGVVDSLEGEISVKSEKGIGTTIIINVSKLSNNKLNFLTSTI